MKKKILKYSVIAILIIIIVIVVCLISGVFGQTQTTLVGSEATETEDSNNYTYNTGGDDSANYVDGDKNGEKSHWVKDGDTWTYTFYVDDPNAQWYIWEDSETLMEGFSVDYAEGNVGTLFTTETLDSFTPDTSKMQSKVDSNGKTVYTWLDSENAYKVTDNGDGTYTKVTTKLSFTITNTKEGTVVPVIEKGSLKISKVVQDSNGNVLTEEDDNTSFQFTVTLSAGPEETSLIEGTKIFGNVVFKDKVAKVALKAGGSITITDLPADVSYSITENEVAGYETSYDSNSGIIMKDYESTATFTNKKIAIQNDYEGSSGGGSEPQDNPNQKYVDITIKKSITGNNEIDEECTIEVELNNLTENRTYELSNGTSFKSDSHGSANVSVKLSKNQSVTLKNIPVGAKYKAFEYAGEYISSYVITDSNNKGSIANTANINTKKNTALSTATETADEDENITITFTNKKVVTQNLKLKKKVTNDEDTNSYVFDIEFGNMEENSSFNSTVGKVIAEQNGKSDLSVYLANGEEVEFYDVPVGTTYRVKELASSSIASYTVVDSNGLNKIAKASDSNTTARKALRTELETVNQGEDVTITFINNTVVQEPESVEVSLGVTKNVRDKNDEIIEDCRDSFNFELIANNTNSESSNNNYPMPDNTNLKIIGNGTASFGTITFNKTGTYSYTIKELSGNSDYYEYDEAECIVTFEVTNSEGLLEVKQTIKKNEFNKDTIEFINKVKQDKDNSEKTSNPDETSNKSDNGDKNEQPGNLDSKEQSEENKSTGEKIIEFSTVSVLSKTGDFVVVYVILAVVALGVIIFVIIKNKKDR